VLCLHQKIFRDRGQKRSKKAVVALPQSKFGAAQEGWPLKFIMCADINNIEAPM